MLDPERALTTDLKARWQGLLEEFKSKTGGALEDFKPTAFESVIALRAALQMILSDQTQLPATRTLRQALGQTLSNGTFDALAPWRKIRFDVNGELSMT